VFVTLSSGVRVLIIADETFAAHERSMLLRLEIGLIDEGVRVVHAVPRAAAGWNHSDLFSQAVSYESRGMSISRAWRAQQLVAAVLSRAADKERPVDIVHAFGRESWAMATEVSRQVGASLAIEVFTAEDADAAARLRSPGDVTGPILFVPDPALEKRLKGAGAAAPVRVTPWGVHTPSSPRPPFEAGHVPSIMIAGTGRDAGAMLAALEGLAAVSPRVPDLMAFAEAEAVRVARVWPAVKRLGLTERFTLIPDLEARRDLVLRGDILLLPEARGDHRSLTMDAMAAGMVLIAAADPMVGVLIDHRTARLVHRPSAEHWSGAISWALDDQEGARSLAGSAQGFVRAHCRASSHVASVVDAYEWMTAAESIPFEAKVPG